MPKNYTAASEVDERLIHGVAKLYASHANVEAQAMYQALTAEMEGPERLKFADRVQEEVLRIRNRESQLLTIPKVPASDRGRNLWEEFVAEVSYFVENTLHVGSTLLYLAFWAAVGIVVFTMACKIIGF